MKCSFGISDFLEEISSLSHFIVFLYFFALISEEAFLISPCYSLELYIQMLLSFLFSFAFRFSSFHSYLDYIKIRECRVLSGIFALKYYDTFCKNLKAWIILRIQFTLIF